MLKIKCVKIEKPVRKPFKAKQEITLELNPSGNLITSKPVKVGSYVTTQGKPAEGKYLLADNRTLVIKAGVVSEILTLEQIKKSNN